MRTDTQLHTIFRQHPNWIFALAGVTDPGPCDMDSPQMKALSVTADARIIPEDAGLPIYIVEFQITDGDNIYLRTAKAMVLGQEHWHTSGEREQRKNRLTGVLRPVVGIIFFGDQVARHAAEPWNQMILSVSFEESVKQFAEQNPDHPMAHMFFPMLENDDVKLEKEAGIHYHALEECEQRGEIGPDLKEVFEEWIVQRFRYKTKEELRMLSFKDLPRMQDTVWGRELVEDGVKIGIEQGIEIGRKEERQEVTRQHNLLTISMKFGEQPEGMKRMIQQLKIEDAQELMRELILMTDIGELIHWLESRPKPVN